MTVFADEAEFREVMDRAFAMMSEDPEIGPKLRAADVPQRFEFTDLGLVLNARPARDGEDGNLHWTWGDEADFEPVVRMAMTADVAARYIRGEENVPMAIARRRIKVTGDPTGVLALIPITQPVFKLFRKIVEVDYPHLLRGGDADDRPR